MDARVTELEVKLAFAEDMLDTLNNTVFRQQEQIDRLLREMRELREQLRSMPTEPRSLFDELPPHY
ncbi:SlyX family protein [Rhodocyclaceae bacterium]